ncbi:hypothetical protein [Gordonia sp. C13]|uniref:hypothetical protein n=1 Tax=Gordonia sp. C13 TaxID=2935078 RepID=UPI00200B0463|nr:hypothetical protein [Gordonia sp. C13]MCK8616730.1 hypothetical protein [Gordonia sp. C13]
MTTTRWPFPNRVTDTLSSGSPQPRNPPLLGDLPEISERRQHLTAELESVKADLKQGAKYIDLCLTLIANPAQLYATASDEVRRRLNQAIFKRLCIHAEEITGHDLSSPLAEMVAADAGYRAEEATGDAEQGRDVAHASYHKHTGQSKDAVISDGAKLPIDDLLLAVNARADCSKDSMVREGGLEPPRP